MQYSVGESTMAADSGSDSVIISEDDTPSHNLQVRTQCLLFRIHCFLNHFKNPDVRERTFNQSFFRQNQDCSVIQKHCENVFTSLLDIYNST